MDVYIGMRIFDDKAELLNEMDTTLKNCMDTCIKDKYCHSFSFDKSGEDRTYNCATYKWYQHGHWPSKPHSDIDALGMNPEFHDDEAYTSGILCSSQPRHTLKDYRQLDQLESSHQSKPNRQPDNKYTLEGK